MLPVPPFGSPLLLLALSLAAGGESGSIEVGTPLWSGHLDGLARSKERRSLFELAPGGKGFLYVQGAPWRRVMYRAIDRPEEPARMVGAVAPFGDRPPRFAPSGDWVYFTAVEGSSALPPPPAALRPSAVRVAFPSMALEHLYPEKGSPTDTFALLLDVHPTGETLLLGTGSWSRAGDAAPGGHDLEAAELSPAGTPRPLGFHLPSSAAVHYGGGGRWIDYGVREGADPEPGGRVSLYRFDRSEKRHRLLDSDLDGLPVPAGELEVTSILPPHLGSFGWDGFLTYFASEPGDSPRPLRLRFPREVLALSITPPVPVGFRAGRVLLAGGLDDRLVLMAAPFSLKDSSSPAASEPLSHLLFDARLRSGEILARAGDDVKPLLEALARSLRPSPGGSEGDEAKSEPPRALAATFVEKGLAAAGAAGSEVRVEVLELSPGYLRVERFYPAPAPPPREPKEKPPPEKAAAGGPDKDQPVPAKMPPEAASSDATSEVAAFDGKRCWLKTREDAYIEIPPADFCREVNRWSLFRLLLDPAGLGDPRLSFSSAAALAEGEASDRDLRHIQFSYEDGFEGELVVEVSGDRVLPVRLRTPLLFPSHRLRREMGTVPAWKEMSFDDWQEWEGRRVPHILRFEDGVDSRVVALLRLESRSGLSSGAFRAPGR